MNLFFPESGVWQGRREDRGLRGWRGSEKVFIGRGKWESVYRLRRHSPRRGPRAQVEWGLFHALFRFIVGKVLHQ